MCIVPLKAFNRTKPVNFDTVQGVFLIIDNYPLLKDNECLIAISNWDNPNNNKEKVVKTNDIIPLGICNLHKLTNIKTMMHRTGDELLTYPDICTRILNFLRSEYSIIKSKDAYDIVGTINAF